MSEYDCVGVTSEYLKSLKNKIEELEQQNKELGENEQHYKKVYLEELALKSKVEQQKAELCEKLIAEILKMPNLKSEYCRASIIIVRNALDNLGYRTDKPKHK